jgi:hypothetical protein
MADLSTPDRIPSDAQRGKATAQLIWQEADRDGLVIEDPFTQEFADAALEEFERLQEQTPGIFRKIKAGAEDAAEQLNVQPFHGVFEAMQNADDVGATLFRLAITHANDGYHLLLSHNGARVNAMDAIAMAFPFYSTKSRDARAKGRFGIGQKTLGQIATRIGVHNPPYHFAIEDGRLRRCNPYSDNPSFVRPSDTLLDVHVRPDFDSAKISAWINSWDESALLFLDSIRTVSQVDPDTGAILAQKQLVELDSKEIPFVLSEVDKGNCIVLQASGSQRVWTRYSLELPVPQGVRRSHKATGNTTLLGISVPHEEEGCKIYAGLPLAIESHLPFDINGQFDPDTSRSQLQQTSWNEWLFTCLADFCTAVALHRFAENPQSGWVTIPLGEESVAPVDSWLSSRIDSFVTTVQARIRDCLLLPIGGEGRTLSELVYEDAAAGNILTIPDCELLSPGRFAIPTICRDSDGRWRLVLGQLGQAERLGVKDALKLLDLDDQTLGLRDPDWFLSIAGAAIGANIAGDLLTKRSILLMDEVRIAPKRASKLPHLVSSEKQELLAVTIGLVHRIHPVYLSESDQAERVRAWLNNDHLLTESLSAKDVLEALAEQGKAKPFKLEDSTLLMLRSVLLSLPLDDQRSIGPRLGVAVLVEGFRWVKGKRVKIAVKPRDAYQPAAVEGGPDSWSKAAGDTPGLLWIASRYANVLRGDLGARAFFTLLGAEVAPRLTPPKDMESKYNEFAACIVYPTAPKPQIDALKRLNGQATHLRSDLHCPDLDAVMTGIAKLGVRTRRDRAKALVATLNRAWQRLYGDHKTADAVYSNWGWISLGEVPATWLAIAMVRPWLSNLKNTPKAPIELAVPTDGMLRTFGEQRHWFAAELDADDARSPSVIALGPETYPKASRIVAHLTKLRVISTSGASIDPTGPAHLYAALAELCPSPKDLALPEKIDDLPVQELKAIFGTRKTGPGLVFADGQWLPSRALFRGPPIFGRFGRFVPERTDATTLWDMMEIKEPTTVDCIKVLERMAQEPFSKQDHSILLDTYRHLVALFANSPPRIRRMMAGLPLWCGNRWVRQRPVYAVENPFTAEALRKYYPVWEPPVPLHTLRALIEPLSVTALEEQGFTPTGVDARSRAAGVALGDDFRSGIHHLRDLLAQYDASLYHSCTDSLQRLEIAQLAVSPELGVEVRVSAEQVPVHVRVRAHASANPTVLCFQDELAVGEFESGGRLIATLCRLGDGARVDEDKLALMWPVAWQRAKEKRAAMDLRLAQEQKDIPTDPLEPLSKQIKRGSKTRIVQVSVSSSGGSGAGSIPKAMIPSQAPPPVRRLKSLDTIQIGDIEEVNVDSAGGTMRRVIRKGLKPGLPDPKTRSTYKPAPLPAQIAYSDKQLEEAGFAMLATVLKDTDDNVLGDFRRSRGVGADGVDRTKRFFELKVSGRDVPNSVTLTGNEAERAALAGDDFFLVVVSGLEEGYDTAVRFISRPLRTLDWNPETNVTLSGIKHRKALVVPIE